MMRKCNDK